MKLTNISLHFWGFKLMLWSLEKLQTSLATRLSRLMLFLGMTVGGSSDSRSRLASTFQALSFTEVRSLIELNLLKCSCESTRVSFFWNRSVRRREFPLFGPNSRISRELIAHTGCLKGSQKCQQFSGAC